ncbi:MAG TPA: ester cyclase [Ktedonobacterales bacterium]|nr:ester cyclase [Ktedonobacterales bacterium]
MSSTRVALIKRLYTEFYNERKVDAAAQAALSIFRDPQRFIDEYKALRTAFPDMQVSPDVILEAGRHVTVRWTMLGTQQGVLTLPRVTIPATGLGVTVLGISLFEVTRGLIENRVWATSDGLEMLYNLGVRFVPPPSP